MDSPVQEHRDRGPKQLGFAVVTVSSSRTLESDDSGRIAADLIADAGHICHQRDVVLDDVDAIRHCVWDLLDRAEIDVVVLDGGTGFSPTDVTPEAVLPLFERAVDGFGELFRALSFEEIGSAAMLSRACAGVVGRRVLFALPGSPKAVSLAMQRLILPEVGHLLGQVRRAT